MNGSRAWMIALAASAAINVFLIGGFAGMAFVRLTAPPPAPPPPMVAPSVPPRPAAQPAAPMSETPKPTHHAAPPAVAPAPIAGPPPAPAPVAPSSDASTAAAAAARPPLISAGDALSPESRQAFRKALNEANKRNRPISQQARAERQAALAALTSPGYDPAEVGRRLATARDLDQQARANVEAALSAFTATQSPQERAVLADGLSKVYAPLAARRQMPGPN